MLLVSGWLRQRAIFGVVCAVCLLASGSYQGASAFVDVFELLGLDCRSEATAGRVDDELRCWRLSSLVNLSYITYLESAIESEVGKESLEYYKSYYEDSIQEYSLALDATVFAEPRTIIENATIKWEFYDSKGNFYDWSMPIDTYEDFANWGREHTLASGPMYVNRYDGQTLSTISLDGFVVGYFGNVIDEIYSNSYNATDFVNEVWFVVSSLTVYDKDVYPHSEGRFALETFSRTGGDCEDLVILVADMLVSSEHTTDWTIQYVYMDSNNLTDPQIIDHVILYVDTGKSTHLIEATGPPSELYYPNGVTGWNIDVQ